MKLFIAFLKWQNYRNGKQDGLPAVRKGVGLREEGSGEEGKWAWPMGSSRLCQCQCPGCDNVL